MKAKFDYLDFIMEVESEGFNPDNEDHINGLQEMINSGLVWKLQGSWQRLARRAIDYGLVREAMI